MSKKTFNLVVGVLGGVSAIAIATVTYIAPANMAAINVSITIATTAVTEICSKFTKD